MSRSLQLYLDDILNSINKIQKYTTNLTYEKFIGNEQILDAVTHNLLIIGEATKNIPDSLRLKYPQMEWKKIAGLRDIIAHAYFSINEKMVWSIIQTNLDSLKICIQLIQENEILDNY
jgi:uncharacterized protein with HEPN domain